MWGSQSGIRRGQSSSLGYVMLFCIVLSVSMTVVVVGGAAIDDARSSMESESAGQSMSQMQADSAEAGSQDGSQRRISFAESDAAVTGDGGPATNARQAQVEGDDVSVDPNAGEIEIKVLDSGGSEKASESQDFGRITYAKNGDTHVYQGGAVFRKAEDGDPAVMTSPPNFEYQYRSGTPTLSMGITTIDSGSFEAVNDGTFSVQQSGSERLFPSSSLSNPIESSDTLVIEIESEYYRAWGQLFEDRTEGSVSYDDSNKKVTLELSGTPSTGGSGPISNAVFSVSGSAISNTGDVDSYRSESGGYPTGATFPHRSNGDVMIDGDFVVNNNPHIAGDLKIAGDLEGSNNYLVEGETVIGGDARASNNPEFQGPFTVVGDLDLGTSSLELGDEVVVGGDFVSLHGSDVGGSIYVHGSFMDNDRDFEVDTVHGSIQANEKIDLSTADGARDAEIRGDLVSGESIVLGSDTTFVGPDSEIHAADDVTVEGGSTYDADIVAADEVTVESGATVDGDIDAGGDVYVHGTVTGDIEAGGSIHGASDASWTANGSPASPTSPTLPPADPPSIPSNDPAEDEIDPMRSFTNPTDNDNAGSDAGHIESWGDDCNPCSLSAGDYAVDRMALDGGGGETLDIYTGGDDVNIYVDGGDLHLAGAEINVHGSGQVKIAVDGGWVFLGSGTEISIPDDNANQLWVYTMPSAEIQTYGNPSVTGVFYGADGSGGGTSYDLSNNFELYGALVGDASSISNNPAIHFDESLVSGGGPGGGPGSGSGDEVGFLQVSVTEVSVSD